MDEGQFCFARFISKWMVYSSREFQGEKERVMKKFPRGPNIPAMKAKEPGMWLIYFAIYISKGSEELMQRPNCLWVFKSNEENELVEMNLLAFL